MTSKKGPRNMKSALSAPCAAALAILLCTPASAQEAAFDVEPSEETVAEAVADALKQLAAAADVGRDRRAACRHALQHRQRLSLGQAGQEHEIDLLKILEHVDAAGEDRVLQSQLVPEIDAFRVVFLVLLGRPHDVQPHVVPLLADQGEGV